MKQYSRTTRILVVALLVFLGVLALYGGLHYMIVRHQAELVALHNHVGVVSQTQESIRSMQTLVEETTAQRNELNGYLLAVDDPAPFLELVEAIGTDAQVELTISNVVEELGEKTVQPGKATLGPPSVHVSVSLEASGTWSELYAFITLLETMPYAVTIAQVALERDTEGGAGRWTALITVHADTPPKLP